MTTDLRFLNEFAAIDESPVHNACRKLSEAFRANGQQWQGIKEMSERVQQDLNTFYTKVRFYKFHKHDFEIMKLGNRGAERRNY